MSIYDIKLRTIDGEFTQLPRDKTLLLVNVASFCGLTSHYSGLQALQDELGSGNFTVIGFPCNQFGAQEPGTAEEIKEFCETSFGVTFPLMEKIDVNGEGRHPLYAELTQVADAHGHDGDIRWNFEKFVVSRDGTITRFSPAVAPDAPELRAAIEASA